MKNLKKFIALVCASAGLGFAAQAAGTTGDIYEIEKLIGDYGVTDKYPSATDPIVTGGQEVRFVFHLAAKDADTKDSDYTNWSLRYYGIGSAVADFAATPLKIGIVVSGKLRWATLKEMYLNSESPYTRSHSGCEAIYDIVFSYKTEAGDYAMPIRLALKGSTEDKPIAAFGTSSDYAFQNSDKWWFSNDDDDVANFKLVDLERRSLMPERCEAWKNPVTDLTLAQAGFYVRTVNFTDPDPEDWEKPSDYWRSVQSGSGITGKPATLTVKGLPTSISKLYAWSTNQSVVVMSTGTDTKMGLPEDGSVSNTFKVATINIVGGLSTYTIPLRGVNVSETKADIFISQYPGFRFDEAGTGTLLNDFLTVPVKCVEAPKPSVKVSFDADATEFTYNKGEVVVAPYDTAMPTPITMYVTLSDGGANLTAAKYPKGVDILLNPQLAKADYSSVDVYSNNYITVSLDSADAEGKLRAVHFDPGQNQVPVYLFVRGGDIRSASGIKFAPSATNSTFNADYGGEWTGAKIKVRDAVPLLQQPEDGKSLTGDAIAGFDLDVQVLDCYRDMMATNFTVQVGNDKVTGVEFARDVATKVHFKSPGNSGDYKLAVSVIDPNGNTSTNKVSITVTVTPPKTVAADFVATSDATEPVKGTTYRENSNISFSEVKSGDILRPIPRFTLSDANNSGGTLYAFLRPLSEAASNKVACAAFTEGVPIPLYSTTSEPNDKFRMTFIDGCSETGYLEFAIELRTGPTLNDPLYTEFVAPKNVNLTVDNVEPEIVKLTYNGTPLSDGASVHVADGIPATFTMTVDDASKYDLTNDTQRIVTVWRFEDDGGLSTYEYITNTVGSTVTCNHMFGGGGSTQKVEVYALDKDMDPETEQGKVFTINILVDESPFIYFSTDKTWHPAGEGRIEELTLDENAAAARRNLYLFLSNPAGSKFTANYPLKVQLKVEKIGATGNVTLDKYEVSYTSGQKGGESVAGKANWSRITLENIDGGVIDDSVFQITATPTWKGSEADTGYIGASLELTLNNVPPTIKPAEPMTPTTNKTVAVNQEFSITVTSVGDITPDLNAGLTCDWYIDDVKVDGKTSVHTKVESFVVEGLKFTSDGFHEVRLEVTDKEGADSNGLATRRWYYYISPTKRLEATPFGPGSTSSMVSKYGTADGLGKGRVWAPAASIIASEFTSTFNCNLTLNELTVYAYGYVAADSAAGYEDNGRLTDANGVTGQDTPISPAGAYAESAPYFTYGVHGRSVKNEWMYDNYFYCWVNSSDEGCLATKVDGIPKPSTVANGPTKVSATLEAYEANKESYGKREIEVVFSREWMPSDNGGDINADGIPDVYMLKYWKGAGASLLSLLYGDADGNVADLKDIAATNPDNDYLPGVLLKDGETGLVDGAKKSYAPIGKPFDTYTELRGFGDGLNAQDLLKSDPWFNKAETNAWVNFLREQGETVDDKNPPPGDLTRWTPEPGTEQYPRMDPTTNDTDGDGFDDGWEYYFWYAAHVLYPGGELKAVDGQLAPFERFDPSTFVYGIPMTNAAARAEIEKRFNPCDKREKLDGTVGEDFDKDGLSDYEEYLIGTNPLHWDTDGDHMCDAWEVMACLNPLDASDKSANVDHDFMAAIQTWGIPGYKVKQPDGTFVWYFDIYGYLDGYYDPESGELFEGAMPVTVPVMLKVVPLYEPGSTTNVVLYGRHDDVIQPDDDPDGFSYFYTTDPKKLEKVLKTVPNTMWGGMYVRTPTGDDGNPWFAKDVTIPFTDNPEVEAETRVDLMTHFVMLHDQIKGIFGFDPRTAWNINNNGYVDKRWEAVPFDSTGVAVNTEPFSAYDEYLGGQYRTAHGILYPGEKAAEADKDPFGWIRSKTTNPSIPYSVTADTSTDTNGTEVVTVSTNTTVEAEIADAIAKAFAKSGKHSIFTTHGADTDGDGVPDGWELYVMRNPSQGAGDEENPTAPYTKLLLAGDIDDDGLTYACEFAGTDSCNAYADCESIYKNHPGLKSGWYNKFFPSDPDNGDTDGDAIADGLEGMGWVGPHSDDEGNLGNSGYSFIYGTPTDDGSQCIRGGGTNPLSVDTDLDGLPDPWERQYCGLPFDLAKKGYYSPTVPLYVDADVELEDEPVVADARLVAAGISSKTFESGVILIDGMDATWGGDALTDPFDLIDKKSRSYDPLTGTVRDVDYDQDGLQNWQEYLVQATRHFRYDDITTPLMGRVFFEGARDRSGNLLEDHRQKFYGFMPMQQEVEGMVKMAGLYLGDSNVVEAHQASSGGGMFNWYYSQPWSEKTFRSLGYMAPRTQRWDRYGCNPTIEYPYLMMPVIVSATGAGGTYVSTDPRLFDTDGDGMDDYYEMFHGLNPLLGSTTDRRLDVIAQAYGVPDLYNAFWNEWTHPDFNRDNPFSAFPSPGSQKLVAAISAPMALDPVLYPWAIGTYEADPDGDGIRNDEERILANVASATPTHTDPTPMWMTDTSATKSYTWQYYQNSFPSTKLPFYPSAFGIKDESYALKAIAEYDGYTYVYSHEKNEGYDTDNDWSSDGDEIAKSVHNATSPRVYSDPERRQAIYFPGKDAYAMTRDLQDRVVDAQDMLKQFTVECWIRPEANGTDQTVIERSCLYGGDGVTKLGGVIRANFRIGLSADGRVYGMFDNNDAIESGLNQPKSCQRVDGPAVALSKWTHVALTYNGKTLILYVNGQEEAKADGMGLIPANGVMSVQQAANDSSSFPEAGYASTPLALFIGARPKHMRKVADREIPLYTTYIDPDTGVHRESFDNMREYYNGYVDEVRIWDGARTASEISENYGKRMSFAEIGANRTAVYESWQKGATRNDNDGKATLPAELIQHYNFVTLPGAVNAKDVALTPSGFDMAVDAQAQNGYKVAKYPDLSLYGLTNPKGLKCTDASSYAIEGGLNVGWWTSCLIRSTVYSDTRVIPWIENGVGHLPSLEGGCYDSRFQADTFAGAYTPVSVHELTKFAYPNEANPYQDVYMTLERYVRLFQMKRMVEEMGEDYEPLQQMFEYEVRSRFLGTSDLLPLGGAYAKTCPQMWDDGSAADAWEQTGTDPEGVGLPKWWTDYARENYCPELPIGTKLTWETAVDYHGQTLPAYQAYLIDLARGIQPDGTFDATYAARADTDGDNIPDWWERLWNVEDYGADDDPDGDGLSNYAEYLITEFFHYAQLDPTKAKTDGFCVDYFRKVGEVYLGEIFTDHDQVDDLWELANAERVFCNTYVWDADRDLDGNGWDNWSESLAYLNAPSSRMFVGVKTNVVTRTGIATKEEADEIYAEQYQLGGDAANVIMFYDVDAKGNPTSWQVSWREFEDIYDDVVDYSGHPIPTVSLALSFGREVFAVDASNVTLRVEAYGSSSLRPDAVWTMPLSVADIQLGSTTVTLKGADNGYVRQGANTFVCFVTGGGDAKATKATGSSSSSAKTEGESAFTPGQPYGVATDVDVGWYGATCSIELTRTSPIFSRVNLYTGDSDRTAIYGTDGGDVDGSTIETDEEFELWALATDESTHVRVVPYMIRGTKQDQSDGSRHDYVALLPILADRTVAEFDVNSTFSQIITEANFLRNGQLDIDWDGLSSQIASHSGVIEAVGDLTGIRYRLVIGNSGLTGPRGVGDSARATSFEKIIERRFESKSGRTKPTKLDTDAVQYGARPTFRWRLDEPTAANGFASPSGRFGCSYTAFQIQVFNEDTDEKVYDTGLLRAPARSAEGIFSWTPALYAGDQTDLCKIFAMAGNWKWRVAMYNSKFKPLAIDVLNGWSEYGRFSTSVGAHQGLDKAGYASVSACVKYTGPIDVLKGCETVATPTDKVRVQAFATPDFSGEPVAQGFITNIVALTNVYDAAANATLPGLKSGTYYIRAYIDSNGNFKRDAWESWGSAKGAVTVVYGQKTPLVSLYIEDCDTDGDWLPDAWEYKKPGYTVGESDATVSDGKIVLKSETFSLITNGTSVVSGALTGATLQFFENLDAAALLLSLPVGDRTVTTFEAIRKAVEKKVNPSTLKVTSLAVDPAAGTVKLSVSAQTTDSLASLLLSPVYSVETKVTVKVYCKENLASAGWGEPVKTVEKTIAGSTLEESIEFDINDPGIDYSKGFYKVEIEQ